MIEPGDFEQTTTEVLEESFDQLNERYYVLRLYVAGSTAQSMMALRNIKRICEEYLKGRYELEVIDIYQQTEEIMTENIVAVPTLIKKLPLPLQRMIGNLSNTEKVLMGLDILPKHTVRFPKDQKHDS